MMFHLSYFLQVAVKTLKDKCKSLDDVMALPEVKVRSFYSHLYQTSSNMNISYFYYTKTHP